MGSIHVFLGVKNTIFSLFRVENDVFSAFWDDDGSFYLW